MPDVEIQFLVGESGTLAYARLTIEGVVVVFIPIRGPLDETKRRAIGEALRALVSASVGIEGQLVDMDLARMASA